MNLPYWNDWTALVPGGERQFFASKHEIDCAIEAQVARELKQEAQRKRDALFTAILQREYKTAEQLIRLPLLLEHRAHGGMTALALACAVGDIKILAMLLDSGASVIASDTLGATPLIHSSFNGHLECVNLILSSKQGGEVGKQYLLNQTSKHGEVASMAAAKAGHLDTLAVLLSQGAPLVAATHEGVDMLMLACRHDRLEVVKYLMGEQNMDPMRRDSLGRTSLIHAAAGGAFQVVQLLLEKLCDQQQPPLDLIEHKDNRGNSLLYHACLGGSLPTIQALLARGVPIDQHGTEGAKLLCLACSAGHTDVIRWMVDSNVGALQLVTDGPYNPLFAAVKVERKEMVDLLLNLGARIDVRDGRNDMAKFLIARGASMILTDKDGRVPRQIAYFGRHPDTAQLLSDLAHHKLYEEDDDISDDVRASLLLAPKTPPSYPHKNQIRTYDSLVQRQVHFEHPPPVSPGDAAYAIERQQVISSIAAHEAVLSPLPPPPPTSMPAELLLNLVLDPTLLPTELVDPSQQVPSRPSTAAQPPAQDLQYSSRPSTASQPPDQVQQDPSQPSTAAQFPSQTLQTYSPPSTAAQPLVQTLQVPSRPSTAAQFPSQTQQNYSPTSTAVQPPVQYQQDPFQPSTPVQFSSQMVQGYVDQSPLQVAVPGATS
eukprot:gene2495-5448_t